MNTVVQRYSERRTDGPRPKLWVPGIGDTLAAATTLAPDRATFQGMSIFRKSPAEELAALEEVMADHARPWRTFDNAEIPDGEDVDLLIDHLATLVAEIQRAPQALAYALGRRNGHWYAPVVTPTVEQIGVVAGFTERVHAFSQTMATVVDELRPIVGRMDEARRADDDEEEPGYLRSDGG